MPIRGLTDRGQAEFPRIGVLRKGAARTEEDMRRRRPGRDLPHFRFTSDFPEVTRAFQQIYGQTPASVRVYLPFPHVEGNLDVWREEWVAGGLKHRCDGERCVVWQDDGGEFHTAAYGDLHAPPCPGGCKQVARLALVIPELRRLALVTALTSSVHDILNLQGQLLALEGGTGSLQGIPLLLRRAVRQVSTPQMRDGKVQRTRVPKSLLSIEASPDWAALRLAAMDETARPKLLGAGDAPPPTTPSAAAILNLGPDPAEDFGEADDEEEAGAGGPDDHELEHYVGLMRAADELGIDLAPYETTADISDAELLALTAKLKAAIERHERRVPRQAELTT